MGALFDKKIILVNIGILFFLILWPNLIIEFIPVEYRPTLDIVVRVTLLGAGIFLNMRYQRSKKLGSTLTTKFTELGYDIVNERPLNLVESMKYGVKISTGNMGGLPIGSFRYHSTNQRVFLTKRLESGNEWELTCEIYRSWSNKITVEVLAKERLTW